MGLFASLAGNNVYAHIKINNGKTTDNTSWANWENSSFESMKNFIMFAFQPT